MASFPRGFAPLRLVSGALALTFVSLLPGCPKEAEEAERNPLAAAKNLVTLSNDGSRDIVVQVTELATSTTVDLAVIEAHPDYVFEEAFDRTRTSTVTLPARSSKEITLQGANGGPPRTVSIATGSTLGFLAYEQPQVHAGQAIVHLDERGIGVEGPVRFAPHAASSSLVACTGVTATSLTDPNFPALSFRIDELDEETITGLVTLRSGETKLAFDGALFPFEEGDVIAATREAAFEEIFPVPATKAASTTTATDARFRVTSEDGASWWYMRGNTLSESLARDLDLVAELGPACIERRFGAVAVAEPVRLATAAGAALPLAQAVTLETKTGKLTVRVGEAFLRTGLTKQVALGPSFRIAARRDGPAPTPTPLPGPGP